MPKVRVAILTSFADINHGYSLTGIVEDQCRMLIEYGHDVHLFVCSHFNDKEVDKLFQHDPWTKAGVVLHKDVPFAHLKDYRSEADLTDEHKGIVEKTAKMLEEKLLSLGIEIVFTHDWLFTGWNLPYGLGVLYASQKQELKYIAWMHWIHSIPSLGLDWWNIQRWGSRHRLIYPNSTDALRVAEQYRANKSYVIPIPHIKDYRSYWEFHEDTYAFLREFPSIMQSEILQVYPASTDRLSSKRVDKMISMFREMKNMRFKVCLVIANQWATGRARKEDLKKYYKRVRNAGLKINEEVIFTSEWRDKFATGIPRRMLRELQLMSNLFIFPTREESFGLVAPEAALSGVMMVLNRSLTMMIEVQGGAGVYVEFGSYERDLVVSGNEMDYIKAVSSIIIGRMQRNEAITSKTFNRIRYNWDNLYNRYYFPTFGESDLW